MIGSLRAWYQTPRPRRLWQAVLMVVAVSWLVGCASSGGYARLPGLVSDETCRQLLTEADMRIEAAQSADPLGHPVPGYPYLRSDRLVASFASELSTPEAFRVWYDRLYQSGDEARRNSLDNLPPATQFSPAERADIESCVRALAERDLVAGAAAELPEKAAVPDAYNPWMRALGLFPLTRLVVLYQVERWKQLWEPRFNQPEWREGEGSLYVPPPAPPLAPAQVAAWLRQAREQHPLEWPLLPPDQRKAVLDRHAPAWWVQRRFQADRIGRPYWQDQLPNVDTDDPVSYRWTSMTRLHHHTLLQLNYLVWFPERPPQQRFDIYAGRLDGLIWRVTLGVDGRVLLYDSIHPCGCYHLMLPVDARLQPRPLGAMTETPLILTAALPQESPAPLLLQTTPGDHYLVGVGRLSGTGVPYRHEDYDHLRHLPADGGTRNLFAPSGLVPASARPERFLLWPMGVASAGAIRIRGDHAISFANRRHFDDPRLLESLFEWREE